MSRHPHTFSPIVSASRATTARATLGAAALLAITLGACPSATRSSTNKTCSGAQALVAAKLRGASLPDKTLALTFDDGPGLRTLELSAYLHREGIQAAFFVNGKNVVEGTNVLARLAADGHLVANHTETHADLTTLAPPQIVAEVTSTDAKIAPYVPNARFLFRPPFGAWDPEKTFSALEESPMQKYVGPIDWDIGEQMTATYATDWDCWKPGNDGKVLTVAECAARYHAEITDKGRGIVLMHDPYFIDDKPASGGTVDMVALLVPELKREGYTFERVDRVPEIAALLPPLADADAGTDAAAPAPTQGPLTSGTPQEASDAGSGVSGGKPDPCPPSPHANFRVARESGNLLAR